MEFRGFYEIPRPVDEVWAMLNDPDVLRQCIPGCKELSTAGEHAYQATVQVKVGPVRATFTGSVLLSHMDRPSSFRLSGEGKGGVAGMASGHADVRLEPHEGGTLLSYAADANVAGKIAQLGGRLIDSTARKLTDQFFDNFESLAAAQGARMEV